MSRALHDLKTSYPNYNFDKMTIPQVEDLFIDTITQSDPGLNIDYELITEYSKKLIG